MVVLVVMMVVVTMMVTIIQIVMKININWALLPHAANGYNDNDTGGGDGDDNGVNDDLLHLTPNWESPHSFLAPFFADDDNPAWKGPKEDTHRVPPLTLSNVMNIIRVTGNWNTFGLWTPHLISTFAGVAAHVATIWSQVFTQAFKPIVLQPFSPGLIAPGEFVQQCFTWLWGKW